MDMGTDRDEEAVNEVPEVAELLVSTDQPDEVGEVPLAG